MKNISWFLFFIGLRFSQEKEFRITAKIKVRQVRKLEYKQTHMCSLSPHTHTVFMCSSRSYQLHEAVQLPDGLWQTHQLVVAGVEDSQRKTTQTGGQSTQLVTTAAQTHSTVM